MGGRKTNLAHNEHPAIGQHFDGGISIKKRMLQKMARFLGYDATYKFPTEVAGTIGQLAGAFLMQLIGSPVTRQAYAHLWSYGVPAIHNGDGTATPILDAWANKDTDIAPLTVDVGTQSVSAGDFGIILAPTNPNAQTLVFFKGAGGGGGGGGVLYGDGSDGDYVIDGSNTANTYDPSSGTTNTPCYFEIFGTAPNLQYIALRPLQFNNLTINAGKKLWQGASQIFCKGTLTINGTLKTAGTSFSMPAASSSTSPFAMPTLGGNSTNGNGVHGVDSTSSFWTYGGRGGSGGNGAGGTGGVGGLPSLPVDYTGNGYIGSNNAATLPMGIDLTLLIQMFTGGLLSRKIQPGTGGGGGAGSGSNTGGQGGDGGGITFGCAKHLAGSGTLDSKGQNAGITGGVLNSGGGGGGGGGVSVLITDDASGWSGTQDVSGGTATPSGGGSGTAGVNGAAGKALLIVVA